MTNVQLQVLKQEFQKDSNWEGEHFTNLSERLGVPRIKVYKWWWDVRKKHEQAKNKVVDQEKDASEKEAPSPLLTTQRASC